MKNKEQKALLQGHGRVICKVCGNIIITCKCPKCSDNIIYTICDDCLDALRNGKIKCEVCKNKNSHICSNCFNRGVDGTSQYHSNYFESEVSNENTN